MRARRAPGLSYHRIVRALAVTVLLLGGCDRVLGLGDITPMVSDAPGNGDGDASGDATGDGTRPRNKCFSDAFIGSAIDGTRWLEFSSAPSPVPQVAQGNGVVEVTMLGEPPPSVPYNGLQSTIGFPFDDATFEMRLALLPTDPHAGVRLYAIADPGHECFVTLTTSLSLTIVDDSGQHSYGGLSVNASTLHYMRLRTRGGTIYVDVADVIGAWTNVIMQTTTLPTSTMAVGFAAGIESPGTSTTQKADFDDALVTSTGC